MAEELLYFTCKINNNDSFNELKSLFNKLKTAKEAGKLHDGDYVLWKSFFTEEKWSKFWNPSQQELDEYWSLYYSLPAEERDTDPRLKVPWDFESWLDAIASAEYTLVSCESVDQNLGRLEYDAWAFPYGSADSLRFLLRVFDCDIIEEETGYRK
ncbi:hypothetical protein P4V47_21235 [Brevibacillus laterosporus]|uniref:hypothetical protein n=2 Tax=Brevibacillus TaxID=55080 RepID=UPI0018CE376D|nr:hypothetical protein [Brevibacillus laterosporus]MBG9790399.1 hypothetical protein [Brevibacillus laterosporus]MCG7318682.1 hypothetical protein [Brevibacillus laterosporus]MED1789967.1 hypothetical protein [Brevibacillus laterosporus]